MRVIRFLAIVALLSWCAAAQALSVDPRTKLWTKSNNEVPVCFGKSGSDQMRNIIRKAIEETWQANSTVRFTRWDTCDPLNAEGLIRIFVRVDKDAEHIEAMSSGSGMQALKKGKPPCQNQPKKGGWRAAGLCTWSVLFNVPRSGFDPAELRYHAVHVFGHVLGFVHESASAVNFDGNNERFCKTAHPKKVAALKTVTPGFDGESVMVQGLCKEGYRASEAEPWGAYPFPVDGHLSKADLDGLRLVYASSGVGATAGATGAGAVSTGAAVETTTNGRRFASNPNVSARVQQRITGRIKLVAGVYWRPNLDLCRSLTVEARSGGTSIASARAKPAPSDELRYPNPPYVCAYDVYVPAGATADAIQLSPDVVSGKAVGAERCTADVHSKPTRVDATSGNAPYPTLVYPVLKLACDKTVRFESETNRPGGDLRHWSSTDPQQCALSCADDKQCRAFTWVKPGVQGPDAQCWLKSTMSAPVRDPCCTSGVMDPVQFRAIGRTVKRKQ